VSEGRWRSSFARLSWVGVASSMTIVVLIGVMVTSVFCSVSSSRKLSATISPVQATVTSVTFHRFSVLDDEGYRASAPQSYSSTLEGSTLEVDDCHDSCGICLQFSVIHLTDFSLWASSRALRRALRCGSSLRRT
jgi:DNA-binding transcriptional regulator YdaS (Cro superfamily)